MVIRHSSAHEGLKAEALRRIPGARVASLQFQEEGPLDLGADDYETGENPGYRVTALQEGQPVGYVEHEPHPSGGTHIRWVEVPDEYRHQGVATALLRHLQGQHGDLSTHAFTADGEHLRSMVREAAAYNPFDYDPMDPWPWQQGRCGTYACALIRQNPNLRFGVIEGGADGGIHFFAHDDNYVYDSLGRHPRANYLGLDNWAQPDQVEYDSDPAWFAQPDEEAGSEGPEPHIQRALQHIRATHPWWP